MNSFIKMATMFITELAEKGATEDELWEAIRFSSELIDLSKKHRISDMTNKYNIECILTVSMLRDLKIKEHKIKTPYEQMKVTTLSPPEYCNMINKLVYDDFKEIIEDEMTMISDENKEKNTNEN